MVYTGEALKIKYWCLLSVVSNEVCEHDKNTGESLPPMNYESQESRNRETFFALNSK